ncbi:MULTISPECIES: hypothetical protein [Acidovorax]|uniref:Uncharacterized protein n=1 Tax=Acidovorax soli TaxID=592050 RepID=A0A1H4BMG7_9BURK|nr:MULTISPECIES: hypothetical protein [Acidovorax]SEA49277.1 hypothetical protein SAMN05421875_11522 [Acidovorax soli]
MTHLPARLVSALALTALATGCAVVPGDPYYTPQPIGYGVYEQSTYIYGSPAAVYGYPVAPPPGYYGRRYDDRNDWRERERAQREREALRDRDARREQDARRDRERDQARREQAQRDQAQRDQYQRGVQAQRDEPRRDQAQRQRRNDERQPPDGNPRQNRPDHPRGRSDAPRGQDN